MKKFSLFLVMLFFLCGCVQEEEVRVSTTTTLELGTTTSLITIASTTVTTTISTLASTSSTTTQLGTTTSTTITIIPTNSSTDLTWGAKPKLALKLNKDTFHSGDQIKVDVRIDSKADLYNVEVRGYGIYAGTHYWLNKTTVMDLKNGTNNVTFYYTTPPCNKCAGIAAGTYTVEADIIYMNKALAHDIKTVSIIQ